MMEDAQNGSIREDLVRIIAERYNVRPEESDGTVIFRAANGRIFASISGGRLDAICGHASMVELKRPYFRPCDIRPDSWVSVELDGLVRFNILEEIIDVAHKFVTSREPMDVREASAKATYHVIAERVMPSSPVRTYTDESLHGPDSGEQSSPSDVPERIKALHNLLTPEEMRTLSESYLFVRQAKFMEKYEDDYVYTGKQGSLFQVYRMMSDQQLRGYFGWRTAVRHGKEHPCSAEYPFIYVCELVNGIGWTDPVDGLKKLTDFFATQPDDVFPHRINWGLDFCAVYNVSGALPPLSDADRASHTLECPYESTPEDALATAVYLSDYKIASSKIMQDYSEDVSQVLLRTFQILHDSMEDHPRTLLDMGFSPMTQTNYRIFASAQFYDPGRGDYEYRIPGVVTYHCAGTNWTKTLYRRSMAATKWFGALTRTVDSLIRPALGVKSAIKPGLKPGASEYLAIRMAVNSWMQEKNRPPEIVVNIDKTALSGIRHDADVVRDRIMTEEEKVSEPVPAKVPAAKPAPAQASGAVLKDIEKEFLSRLLEGKPYQDVLRDRHMSVDIIADMVNEALWDVFSDSVIDMSSGSPEIIEDYRNELEEIVNE